MKKIVLVCGFFMGMALSSCNSERQQNDRGEGVQIQGEETGGMGTGPGPGVNAPIDTAENIQPDTIVID